VDKAEEGGVVIMVGEGVGMGEHHHLIAAVVATDVEQPGIEMVEEAGRQPRLYANTVDAISYIEEHVHSLTGDLLTEKT
jgi:hypothetical protein